MDSDNGSVGKGEVERRKKEKESRKEIKESFRNNGPRVRNFT